MSKPPQSSLPLQSSESASCSAIVFQVAGHWLALPHSTLLQVVHKTVLNQDTNLEQLAYLGKQPFAILNLRPLFAAVRSKQPHFQEQDALESSTEAPFLVIVAVGTTLVGIPSEQLPILLDLPLLEASEVPPSYYNAIQGIASHIVSTPQLGTIFLLNLHAVVNTRLVIKNS